MAKKRKKQSSYPQLVRFFLSGFVAENRLMGQGGIGRLSLSRENDIELETIAPEEGFDRCRVLLRIKIQVTGRRDKDEEDVVRLHGAYEGRFVFPESVTFDEVETVAATEEFQYFLTAQVFPLASAHLKDQLELMGLSMQRMPLGL